MWCTKYSGDDGVPDNEQGGHAVVAAGGEPHVEGPALSRLEEQVVDQGLGGSLEEPRTTAHVWSRLSKTHTHTGPVRKLWSLTS